MITQARLKELLHYNPDTGVFTCRVSRGGIKAGSTSGTATTVTGGKSYRIVSIDNVRYYEHRLAWLYVTGSMPINEIDHKSGDGSQNKWANLREASSEENHKNRRLQSNNTSGVCGVIWRKELSRWEVTINTGHRRFYLGVYKDKFDAICARKSAENKYGFHENHGQIRPL